MVACLLLVMLVVAVPIAVTAAALAVRDSVGTPTAAFVADGAAS